MDDYVKMLILILILGGLAYLGGKKRGDSLPLFSKSEKHVHGFGCILKEHNSGNFNERFCNRKSAEYDQSICECIVTPVLSRYNQKFDKRARKRHIRENTRAAAMQSVYDCLSDDSERCMERYFRSSEGAVKKMNCGRKWRH